MKVIEVCDLGDSLPDVLKGGGFPIGDLANCPVSAIEGIAARRAGRSWGVCGRACVGCSADAIHPRQVKGSTALLTPELLSEILGLAKNLALARAEIISSVRMNLFSGSNELEHPHCLSLRRLMSAYYSEVHGCPYGCISSDLIFHVASAKVFRKNLISILREPLLFDNICIALDEQIPFADRSAYEGYLVSLEWVWAQLGEALTMHMAHADTARQGEPRVILNLLLPAPGFGLEPSLEFLYPGGPPRARSYEELARRYVEPFVGRLDKTAYPIPSHHMFTTAVGTLSGVSGSRVFISEAVFEAVGRATSILVPQDARPSRVVDFPRIRTKIYPLSKSSFAFQAALAPNRFSDGDLGWQVGEKPSWITALNAFEFHVRKLEASAS